MQATAPISTWLDLTIQAEGNVTLANTVDQSAVLVYHSISITGDVIEVIPPRLRACRCGCTSCLSGTSTLIVLILNPSNCLVLLISLCSRTPQLTELGSLTAGGGIYLTANRTVLDGEVSADQLARFTSGSLTVKPAALLAGCPPRLHGRRKGWCHPPI